MKKRKPHEILLGYPQEKIVILNSIKIGCVYKEDGHWCTYHSLDENIDFGFSNRAEAIDALKDEHQNWLRDTADELESMIEEIGPVLDDINRKKAEEVLSYLRK